MEQLNDLEEEAKSASPKKSRIVAAAKYIGTIVKDVGVNVAAEAIVKSAGDNSKAMSHLTQVGESIDPPQDIFARLARSSQRCLELGCVDPKSLPFPFLLDEHPHEIPEGPR